MDDSHRASRAVEVGRLLLKYRNAGIFSTVELDNPLLREAEAADIPDGRPEDFVRDLEALGPTFIKIGQGLSTRPDFVPAPYIEALERMQDDVAPVPVEKIRRAEALAAPPEAGSSPDLDQLFARYEEAMLLDPADEQTFWFAVRSLSAVGEVDRAASLLESLFARAPEWLELLHRLELPEAEPLKQRFPRA